MCNMNLLINIIIVCFCMYNISLLWNVYNCLVCATWAFCQDLQSSFFYVYVVKRLYLYV